jgi:hypothetical protein
MQYACNVCTIEATIRTEEETLQLKGAVLEIQEMYLLSMVDEMKTV